MMLLRLCPHMISKYTQMQLSCGRVPTLSLGREDSAEPSAWHLHLQLGFPCLSPGVRGSLGTRSLLGGGLSACCVPPDPFLNLCAPLPLLQMRKLRLRVVEHLSQGCTARKWPGQMRPHPCSVPLCVCGPENEHWPCPAYAQGLDSGRDGRVVLLAAVQMRPAGSPSCGEGSGSPFSPVTKELRALGQEERVRMDLQDSAEQDRHPWGATSLRRSLPTLVCEGEGSWGGAHSWPSPWIVIHQMPTALCPVLQETGVDGGGVVAFALPSPRPASSAWTALSLEGLSFPLH